MELQQRASKVRQLIETIVKRTISPRWRLNQGGQIILYLQRGIVSLSAIYGVADVDDERIVDYLVYQLYRMRSGIESGIWQYTWLFSKTAMDKFKKQFMSEDGKSGINYYINLWLDEAELSRSQLVGMIAEPKPSPLKQMVYLPSEEPIKRRFLNTPDGLALCQRSTTGWSPLSDACGRCENWVECGRITAQKYPELIRYRKEAYGKQEK